jgi:hypothetical protein
MPRVRLVGKSASAILAALEKTAGLPPVGSGEKDWTRKVLALVNENNVTDLMLLKQDSTEMWFEYSSPDSALLLQEVANASGTQIKPL